MTDKIVLTGATGKLGGAVLTSILEYKLFPPSELVIATSSSPDHPRLKNAIAAGVSIRQSHYDSVEEMTEAFSNCKKLFLVSTPHISLDFDDCAKGGREIHHFNALEAARRAGISHVYYTSLAFQSPSKAAVMRAHLKTEERLESQNDFAFTIIREGIYSESWPLYLGHFDIVGDTRDSIVIGSDSPISWTSIQDLGLANAQILSDDSHTWAGRTIYLSASTALTIAQIASMVADARGKDLLVDIKSQQAYETHYITQKGLDSSLIKWWSSTYLALEDYECEIKDSSLEALLARKDRKPIPMQDTIRSMVRQSSST